MLVLDLVLVSVRVIWCVSGFGGVAFLAGVSKFIVWLLTGSMSRWMLEHGSSCVVDLRAKRFLYVY